MKIESITDFEKLDSPRVQRIPGFYGEKLIDGVVIKNIFHRGYFMEQKILELICR